jgi:hypothetical protein
MPKYHGDSTATTSAALQVTRNAMLIACVSPAVSSRSSGQSAGRHRRGHTSVQFNQKKLCRCRKCTIPNASPIAIGSRANRYRNRNGTLSTHRRFGQDLTLQAGLLNIGRVQEKKTGFRSPTEAVYTTRPAGSRCGTLVLRPPGNGMRLLQRT